MIEKKNRRINENDNRECFATKETFKNKVLIVFFAFIINQFSTTTALSQSIKNVRINEIQVINSDGFRDEYGHAGSWIELFNKGYGKVNLAGCTLKVNENAYQIPKGDHATIIPSQGYLIFFAGGTPDKGTFHTNFTLDDTDFIEFYDTDGKLIDKIQFNPADMIENISFGWFEDHDGKEKLMNLLATTPGSSNNTLQKVHRSEVFRQADPSGIILTIINIIIVSIALTVLFLAFKFMGKYLTKKTEKKLAPKKAIQTGKLAFNGEKKKKAVTNDELAAIAIALYKYSEIMHQQEEMVLTINKVSKVYSPWSSKIYGLSQYPAKLTR